MLPLFFEFLETLDYLGIVNSVNRKTDRLYWGRQEEYKNTANILDDPIDGIDSDLNISLNINDCLIPKNAIRELFEENESTQRRLKRKLIAEVPSIKKKSIKK